MCVGVLVTAGLLVGLLEGAVLCEEGEGVTVGVEVGVAVAPDVAFAVGLGVGVLCAE